MISIDSYVIARSVRSLCGLGALIAILWFINSCNRMAHDETMARLHATTTPALETRP